MKILLSYSKVHFDPDKPQRQHKFWFNSASVLARTLYHILTKMGEVTYINSTDYQQIKGKKFDLFIGIYNNFYQILTSCYIKKSIYFAVNMYPRERYKILLSFLFKERISPLALASWDLQNFIKIEKGIKAADYILCMGNIGTYNSYIKYGVPKDKIKLLNYGLPHIKNQRIHLDNKQRNYLYLTSEIGLRKGFDIIYSIFTNPKISKQKFHLNIIGLPTNKYYSQKLKRLRHLLGNKVTYHGWIDSQLPLYKQIIKKSDFIILPSLEEGQVGSVLDCLSFGVVPLISKNCGIDFMPLGALDISTTSENNLNLLNKTLSLSQPEIIHLKHKTLEYYLEFHHNFEERLENSIKDCLSDKLYPKFSFVLPIYNKERSIKSLLYILHQACYEYCQVELHIIFDGCTDDTEQVVTNFYQKIKHNYHVTFEQTPNIFETKTNNIGLKKSTGKYCVLLQDDNYIFDKNILYEAINFLEKNPKAVILGGLAGVNFYPLGTKLKGKGQIAMNENEVYWRQDERTDPALKKRIFEVDACMRGPLFIRKSFIDKFGYLDESYSPFYMDDMDLCFRARSLGFKVYCLLSDSINKSSTVANYDKKKSLFWQKILRKNSDIFYSRWKQSQHKNYLWIRREKITSSLFGNLQRYSNYLLIYKDDLINGLYKRLNYYLPWRRII